MLAIYLVMLALVRVLPHLAAVRVRARPPNLYGAWLMAIYGLDAARRARRERARPPAQLPHHHDEPGHRFLYWNMNYHLEHHMFPLVPYHQLPRLHTIVKDDCPAPYRSLTAAYREIVPAVLRQISDPGYYRSPQVAAQPRGP